MTKKTLAAVIAVIGLLLSAACENIGETGKTQTASKSSVTTEPPGTAAPETPSEIPQMTRQPTETPGETASETPGETASETQGGAASGTLSEAVSETPTEPPATGDSPRERAEKLAALTANAAGVDNAWALWLINAKNPLPDGYVPSVSPIGTYSLDSRCSEYALLMFEAARNDGIYLNVASAYRSIERQTLNFKNFYNSLLNSGYTPEQAFNATAAEIAPPYTSEHNAGLAADIGLITSDFDLTAEFRWLRDNAWKYGFIMRYPADKTETTGIIYEPWHYRFVGLYHAEKIHKSGLCLEEYMGDNGENNDVNGVVAAFKEQVING